MEEGLRGPTGRPSMKLTLEDRIRQRAYFLWLDGTGAGDDIHFWLIAEREVLAGVAMEAAVAYQLAEATEKPNPAQRVNALVLLKSVSNCQQAA